MQHSSILIIGSRNHNKNNLITDLCKKDYEKILVISHNDFYKENDNFNDAIIEKTYYDNIIKTLLKKQKIEKLNTLLILDDCLSQSLSFSTDAFKELLFNGRHYNITVIITMQYSLGFSPEIRSSFDQVYLYNDIFISQKKRIYEHYCQFIPTFAEFSIIFDDYTKDNIMVIDYTTKPTNCYKYNNCLPINIEPNTLYNYFTNFINKFSCF